MGKVRRAENSSVKFRVTGPVSIFKGPAFKVGWARMDQTWMEFLVNTLKLPIPSVSGFLIRTNKPASAGKKASRQSWGWTAPLDEKIGEFVSKYERHRDQYSVVLICGDTRVIRKSVGRESGKKEVVGGGQGKRPRSTGGSGGTAGLGMTERRTERRIYYGQMYRRLVYPVVGMEVDGGGLQRIMALDFGGGGDVQIPGPVQNVEKNCSSSSSGGSVVEIPIEEEASSSRNLEGIGGDLEEDDAVSVVSAEPQEEIQENNVKVEGLRRLDQFSEEFLLKARQEILELKRRNLLGRSAERSPLAWLLLEHLLETR